MRTPLPLQRSFVDVALLADLVLCGRVPVDAFRSEGCETGAAARLPEHQLLLGSVESFDVGGAQIYRVEESIKRS